jgi:hypothetical protein
MIQISAWLVVMSSVLGQVAPGSSEDEGSNIAADVFADADANKDGLLKHPEITDARAKIADRMTNSMPKPNYISGGLRMIARMRQRIMEAEIDPNKNGEVDQLELAIFANEAIILREQTTRSPLEAQYQLSREASRGKVIRHSVALDKERRAKARVKYDMHYMAHKQHLGMLYDAKLVRDILKSQMALEYEAQRKREADKKKMEKEQQEGKKPQEKKPTGEG